MKITIIGTGYVGLVSGTCFSFIGNDVTCVDIDPTKIQKLNNGEIPIYEPGLEEMVKNLVSEDRLHFTTDLSTCINDSDLVFVAVGTPQAETGATDLRYILSTAEDIARTITHDTYIVVKSTVPAKTCDKMSTVISKVLQDRNLSDINVYMSSNPEFLKEGSAIEDFMKPDRIVIGADDEESKKRLLDLYSYFDEKIIQVTDVKSAQVIKYASNAFNACKISFINSLVDYVEKIGANIEDIADGMGADKRIGRAFLNAGIGYGGSCFPKDVNSLNWETMYHTGHYNDILTDINSSNDHAKMWPIKTLRKIFNYNPSDVDDVLPIDEFTFTKREHITVAVLGLAFKPNTDDVRYSPGVNLVAGLSSQYKVRAYDPIASNNAVKSLANYDLTSMNNITICSSLMDAVEGANVVIFTTEWDEFKNLPQASLNEIYAKVAEPIIIDCRNMFDSEKMSRLFNYHSVGRPNKS